MPSKTVAQYNGQYVVQDGPKFFTAIQLATTNEDGTELNHLLIISGPFNTYAEADAKRRGANV